MHFAHLVRRDIARTAARAEEGIERMQIEGTVAEHDAFGTSGAAAGVKQLGQSVLIAGREVDGFRLRRGQ